MALLDVFAHGTGLISSTLTQDDLTAVSIVTGGALAQEAAVIRALNIYSIRAATGATSGVSYGERDWGSDEATTYHVLYVKFAAVPSAVTSFYSVLDSTPAAIVDLRVSAAGLWSIYNYGDTTTYTSTGPAVLAGIWYRIELKLVVHASAGTLDVKINGVLEPGISGLTGKNTKPGNNARCYRFGVTVAQASTGNRYFSEIGVSNSDWLGRFQVKTLWANANNAANWTTDATTSWESQDDHPWTSTIAADWIYSSTGSQEERYKYPTVAQNGGTWLGVVPVIRHRRNVAGSAAGVTLNVRVAAADGTASGSLDSGGTTAVTSRGATQLTDPNTGSAWTPAGLNALILRIVKDAGANRENIGASLVYVAFSSDAGKAAAVGVKGTRGGIAGYGGYYTHRNKPLRGAA